MDSQIQMQSKLDDAIEERDAALKKVGVYLAKQFAGRPGEVHKLDGMLKRFSDSEKYIIMRYAFAAML